MSGTDPYREPEVSPDLAWRKAVARLRTLLRVNPSQCHLFTRRWSYPAADGELRDFRVERWLSDRYVLVNVTDDLALRSDNEDHSWGVLPDGAYKLTAGKGLVPADHLTPDTAGLVNYIEERDEAQWHPLQRTRWSVADSKAKIMLAYAETFKGLEAPDWERGWHRVPLGINEGIWNAFNEAFWDKLVTFQSTDDEIPYRVKAGNEIVGYIARGELPEDEHDTALRIIAVGE